LSETTAREIIRQLCFQISLRKLTKRSDLSSCLQLRYRT